MRGQLDTQIDKALGSIVGALLGGESADCAAAASLAAATESAAEDAITLLEDTILSAKRWIVQFRRRRNALVPFHRLPLELFNHILEYCLLNQNYPRNYYLKIWQLRAVSVYWLRSIDGLPTVWTSISTTNRSRMVTTAVKNSQDLPIDIQFICRQPQWSRDHLLFASKVTPHSERWRSLTLLTDKAPDLSTLLQLPAPNLTDLWISSDTDSSYTGEIFGGTATQIRNVYLRRCSLSWDTIILSGLNSLVLNMKYGGTPPVSRLVRMLGASPMLRRLEIGSFDMVADMEVPPAVPICLAKLEQLRLSIPEDAASLLLQSMLAPYAQVHLEVKLSGSINTSAVLEHAVHVPDLSPKSNGSTQEIEVSIGETSVTVRFEALSLRIEKDEWYSWDLGMPERLKACQIVFSSMSPETRFQPTRLHFVPDDDSDIPSTYRVVRDFISVVDDWFPNINKITVEGARLEDATVAEKIAEALAKPVQKVDGLRWLCPRMVALTVEVDEGPHDALAEIIHARLESRKGGDALSAPASITRLSLSQGSISRQAMMRLHEVETLRVKLHWVDVVDRSAPVEEVAKGDSVEPVTSAKSQDDRTAWIDDAEDLFYGLFGSST